MLLGNLVNDFKLSKAGFEPIVLRPANRLPFAVSLSKRQHQPSTGVGRTPRPKRLERGSNTVQSRAKQQKSIRKKYF